MLTMPPSISINVLTIPSPFIAIVSLRVIFFNDRAVVVKGILLRILSTH
jgi:hypothetical protein